MNQTDNPSFAEEISSLVDGEADAASLAQVSAHWRSDAELRARWHRYHLIGDVMRSSELAGSGRDAAFLAALRVRLAQEPVVLAPSAPQDRQASDNLEGERVAAAGGVAALGSARSSRPARPASALKRWTPPAALAAGFLVVAFGSASLLKLGGPAEGPVLAQAPVSAPAAAGASAAPSLAAVVSPGLQPVLSAAPVDGPVASVAPQQATGTMIRDARLDGYLAAHKQFGDASALGLPSGFLRNATHDLHEGTAVPGDRP